MKESTGYIQMIRIFFINIIIDLYFVLYRCTKIFKRRFKNIEM